MTAKSLVKKLGVSSVYVGASYLVSAIEVAKKDNSPVLCVTKRIYPEVAREYDVRQEAVERALRTVVKNCWERGNREFLSEIAGFRIMERPRVGELIDWAASYLQNEK